MCGPHLLHFTGVVQHIVGMVILCCKRKQSNLLMKYDYDVIVIGGGAAGLTASAVCAMLGARTLLVERNRTGGDCTWTGCVPSKALIRAAKAKYDVDFANRFGVETAQSQVDFPFVMERVRQMREKIYLEADAPDNLARYGIELIPGTASFANDHEIRVNGEESTDRYSSRYFIIATGSKPLIPKLKGLESLNYLTNESLFELDSLPQRLGILGAGPIGVEMAQAFHRLGSRVTVIEASSRILSAVDSDHARRVEETLTDEGVSFRCGNQAASARRNGSGLRMTFSGDAPFIDVDQLLVATGRQPRIDLLGLENAGVRYENSGIEIDNRCRTNVHHIFAVGDVTGRRPYTHMAEHMGRIAASNAVMRLPWKIDLTNVPWVLFTDPEVASLGETEAQLRDARRLYEVHEFPYDKLDRAVIDDSEIGHVKVFANRGGRILGASIYGRSAGDLVSELSLAMKNNISLRKIAETIHPYPTYGQAMRRVSDQWIVRRQIPLLTRTIARIFRLRGKIRTFVKGEIV